MSPVLSQPRFFGFACQGFDQLILWCVYVVPFIADVPSASSRTFEVALSSFRGESLFDFLTFLLTILAVFASISSLCMSLHSIDLSAMLPRPSASSMCRHFAPVGEFGVFGPALHRFDHCARACTCPMHLRGFQASLASLRVSVLLPGEFGVFEVF